MSGSNPEISDGFAFEDRVMLVLLWRIHLASRSVVDRARSKKAFTAALAQARQEFGLG